MTETIVEKEWSGEFRTRIEKQVLWRSIPISVTDVKAGQITSAPLNLPLIIEFDMRKILEDAMKEAPEEVKKTPWYMKWFKTQ